MRASRGGTRDATNLLTSTPDEAALAIAMACSLLTARDLLCLALTCRRFGIGGGPAAAPERLSLATEAARRWVAGRNDQERGWVSRRGLECWLSLMHEVEVLRLPLAFGRAHAHVTLSENGARRSAGGGFRFAASTAVMRSGRHFAQFTVAEGADIMLGAIRPGWDVEAGASAEDDHNHCVYYTADGSCWPDGSHWQGMQDAKEGDRIGMLLDLDQGSMSIWKNGERLGVMQAEGLRGPLCWAAGLY